MRTRRPLGVVVAATMMAFLGVLAFRGAETASPESRLPRRYRLADLIERQQVATEALRDEVTLLRSQVAEQQERRATRSSGVAERRVRVRALAEVAGLDDVTGPGLRVTLDDSTLRSPPEGASVNDLVVHSQDVQAVVNAVWRSGGEAVSINGQRLVSTSAVLCVGNTLLLNGTVHSPPYVVSAIGASRDRFDDDRLVRRLRQASATFGLRLDVERVDDLTVPAYSGATKLSYARPVS